MPSQELVTLHRELLVAEQSLNDTPSLCRDRHWMGASVAMLAAEAWFRLSDLEVSYRPKWWGFVGMVVTISWHFRIGINVVTKAYRGTS